MILEKKKIFLPKRLLSNILTVYILILDIVETEVDQCIAKYQKWRTEIVIQ